MTSLRSWVALWACGWALLSGLSGPGQAQQIALPSGWQQMSPEDFAAAMRELDESGKWKLLSPTDEAAVARQGRTFFEQIDLSRTALNYQTIEILHWLCRYQIEDSLKEATRVALLARQDRWADQPYAELRAKVAMMNRLGIDHPTMIREIQRWAQAGGSRDDVPPADLSFSIVRQMFNDLRLADGPFTVEWSGLINAPRTGLYQFLISPINVNSGYHELPVKLSMTVSVNNQIVLNSSPDKNAAGWNDPTQWVSESGGVALTAGQPVALSVSVSVEAPGAVPSSLLHALLFWKLPGSSTPVIVPQANLTVPDGSAPGLKATYSWKSDDLPRSLTRTEPNVDVSWTSLPLILTNNLSQARQASDTLWNAMTASSFITATLGSPEKLHPFLAQPDDASAALTTVRRSEFLDLLLDNSKLLDPVDAKQAVRFFEPFRIGAPDKALDVFGVWATRHADLICDISDDRIFNGDQRFAFASMAILTTQQLPAQISDLQNRYLILPDGRCSLPVAYTLACSYLGQKKFDTWVDYLDNKLADTSVTGDVRVNWLIARADADALDPGSARHYPFYYGIPFHEPLEGRKYLDEALKSAQSPAAKLRVAQEIIGRLASRQSFESALTVLQSASQNLPADQQAMATRLQQQLTGYQTAFQQDQADQPVRAQQAHLAELKKRREQAAQRGDKAAISRYDALIGAATKTD